MSTDILFNINFQIIKNIKILRNGESKSKTYKTWVFKSSQIKTYGSINTKYKHRTIMGVNPSLRYPGTCHITMFTLLEFSRLCDVIYDKVQNDENA